MSTDYHTPFDVSDVIDIVSANSRFAELDAAIASTLTTTAIKAALVYDSKSTTTAGGGASATTWNARDLNAEVDPDSIVAVSSNKFTPIAGTYMIWVEAPASEVEQNRVRLYNVDETAVVAEGLNVFAASSGSTSVATLFTIFTADGNDEYRIDHYTNTAQASDGLGKAVGDGGAEIYTQVLLLKIS